MASDTETNVLIFRVTEDGKVSIGSYEMQKNMHLLI